VHGLDFGFFGSGLRLLPTGTGVRYFASNLIQIRFGFLSTEKILLVVCLTCINPDSNRSRISWIWLAPDPDWIWIQSLQNGIGSALKKIQSQDTSIAEVRNFASRRL